MKRILWLIVAAITFLGLLGLAYGCVQCPDPCPDEVAVMAQPSLSKEVLKVTASGLTGELCGNVTSAHVLGELVAVQLEYRGSISTTTDVTVSYGTPSWGTIVLNSNSATDAVLYPYAQPVNSSQTAYTNSYIRHLVDGTLTVYMCQTQAGQNLTATLYYVRP